MKLLPGKEVIDGLASLKEQISQGKIVPPVQIMLERGGEKIVIPFENLADIKVFKDGDKPSNDLAEIKLIIRAADPWKLKVGKDANGKSIFLKNLD